VKAPRRPLKKKARPSPGGGTPPPGSPLGVVAPTPDSVSTDFSSESVTSPKPLKNGEEFFEQVIFTTERNFATRLGNSQRVQKWQKVRFFDAARREWLGAWKRFAKEHGLGSLFEIRSGIQQTLEPVKAFTLAALRRSDNPSETLRKRAAEIYAAACEGDVEFLKQINLAFKSRSRRAEAEADRSFLAYNVLSYWFAGLLWLMNNKAGWLALCEYTKRKDITKDAYRQTCRRLGLNGYKNRTRKPAVFYYDAGTQTYKYGPEWTQMEPHLST